MRFSEKVSLSLFLLASFIMAVPSFISAQEVKTRGVYDPGPGWTLDWSDEFDGEAIDTNKWTFETGTLGGGNMELQYYTDTNAFLSNGNLVILSTRVKNVFLSSRLNTLGKYSFTFGKIVARIKMPEGKGLWPAFWMLGTNKSSVNWPECGEVDIAEVRGGGSGDQVVLGSVHWKDTRHLHVTRSHSMNEPLSRAFHDYELEWDPDRIIFRIDGLEYHNVDIRSSRMDAFRRPFYLILNVAIGGNFSRIYSPSGVTAVFPQFTWADWVRVYRKD